MSEVSERYKRLSDAFAAKVAAVPDDQWGNQSPCEDWKARDVVAHMVQTQGMFLGFIGKELGDIPSAEEDPAGAWDAARAIVQRNLDDPATAKQEFDGLTGRSTFEDSVDKFLNSDLVMHGWDLARATGQDDSMEPEDVKRVHEYMAPMADMPGMRGPNAFGAEVDVPADADDQTKLLAFLGRRP
ncbi:MAG: hypothetical protein QOG87_1845 [Actinomycetota bacterium]|jgi:uncharacterized protein (TIGR03086 family)